MQITINGRELCAIQCALRESAAAATETALMAADPMERQALMANAELFSGLARTLEQRADCARGVDRAYEQAEMGAFGGMVCA